MRCAPRHRQPQLSFPYFHGAVATPHASETNHGHRLKQTGLPVSFLKEPKQCYRDVKVELGLVYVSGEAMHSSKANLPGISRAFSGLVGFEVRRVAPVDDRSYNTENATSTSRSHPQACASPVPPQSHRAGDLTLEPLPS